MEIMHPEYRPYEFKERIDKYLKYYKETTEANVLKDLGNQFLFFIKIFLLIEGLERNEFELVSTMHGF